MKKFLITTILIACVVVPLLVLFVRGSEDTDDQEKSGQPAVVKTVDDAPSQTLVSDEDGDKIITLKEWEWTKVPFNESGFTIVVNSEFPNFVFGRDADVIVILDQGLPSEATKVRKKGERLSLGESRFTKIYSLTFFSKDGRPNGVTVERVCREARLAGEGKV